jgi:hypothetical protein
MRRNILIIISIAVVIFTIFISFLVGDATLLSFAFVVPICLCSNSRAQRERSGQSDRERGEKLETEQPETVVVIDDREEFKGIKTCKICGYKVIDENLNFCPKCGSRI